MRRSLLLRLVTLFAALLTGTQAAQAHMCPFCTAVKTTFTEDIRASDVAALGVLVERPNPPSDLSEEPQVDLLDAYKTTFRITKVLRGGELAKVDEKVIAIYTGEAEPGAMFLLRAIDPPKLKWGQPVELSERAIQYITKILALPEKGSERLAFFEDYLQDEDDLLRNDAFDEFARASYKDLQAIKDRINHERLVGWIRDRETTPTNRRLYFTMLGVCGGPDDLPMMKEMLLSGDRTQMTGLDSLIACYLTLSGPDGLPLIEDLFLCSGTMWDPEYVHTYAAIMALRFHGQESDIIPKERLLASLRIMLDRPQLADLVIRDLARWEDWSVVDRLVQLFMSADKETSWVRVPVVRYLRECPLPEAKEHLAELSKIDPDAVRRAATLFPFPSAGPGAVSKQSDDASSSDDAAAAEEKGEGNGVLLLKDDESESNEPVPKGEGTDEAKEDKVAVASDVGSDSAEAGTGTEAAEGQADEAAVAAQTPVSGSSTPAAEASSSWAMYVMVPVAVVCGLFVLMWLILRRPREPIGT